MSGNVLFLKALYICAKGYEKGLEYGEDVFVGKVRLFLKIAGYEKESEMVRDGESAYKIAKDIVMKAFDIKNWEEAVITLD